MSILYFDIRESQKLILEQKTKINFSTQQIYAFLTTTATNSLYIILLKHNKINQLKFHNIITVPFRAPPRYNPRRRSGLGCWMNYQLGSETYATTRPTSSIGSHSSSWANSHYHAFVRLMSHDVGPPSPCPSDHPFNSASSSLSESSSSHRSQEDDISIVTGKLETHTKSLLHFHFVFRWRFVVNVKSMVNRADGRERKIKLRQK